MQAWWNRLTSSQRSAVISAVGGLLSLVSLFVIPGLNQMGSHCAALLAAFLTFAVNQAQLALLKLPQDEPETH